MSDAVKILRRDVISRGHGLLERVTFWRRRFDGTAQELSRDVYDNGPGATILLYDPSRKCILLVRQFRPATYLVEGRADLSAVHQSGRGEREGGNPSHDR